MHKRFFHKISIIFCDPGFLLAAAAALALIIANSDYHDAYYSLLYYVPPIGFFGKDLSVLLWINDLLMAVFFILVGLEIKRELRIGQLNSLHKAGLPIAAAIGGMIFPALIYILVTKDNPDLWQGWAIASATDIAFSLAVLSALGSRIPASLKIFLTALAIIDDLGAIIIIALFYTAQLHMAALASALGCIAILALLNRLRVHHSIPYILIGAVLWVAVLLSGIHATIAGVILALFIPLGDGKNSPLKKWEHILHPWVVYAVLPVFAFANSGLSFAGLDFSSLMQPLTLAIILGLCLGKPLGIFGASYVYARGNPRFLPHGCGWMDIVGIGFVAGIGFTMSLFIGSLAFAENNLFDAVKLGVLCGSILAAICGYSIFLVRTTKGNPSS